MGHSSTDQFEPSRETTKSGPEAEKRVVGLIVDAVLTQRMCAGDRLVERNLSEASGAGRMAVRNGLIRLASAGLVELTRNRGALIARISGEDAQEIFDARVVIEEAGLRKLARIIDDESISELREMVECEAEAYAANEVEDARKISRQFHITVTALTGNRRMTRFLEDLINCQPLLAGDRRGQLSRFTGVPTHRAIVEALAERDGDKAAMLNTGLLRELENEMALDRAQSEAAEDHDQTKDNRSTGSRAQKARRGSETPT